MEPSAASNREVSSLPLLHATGSRRPCETASATRTASFRPRVMPRTVRTLTTADSVMMRLDTARITSNVWSTRLSTAKVTSACRSLMSFTSRAPALACCSATVFRRASDALVCASLSSSLRLAAATFPMDVATEAIAARASSTFAASWGRPILSRAERIVLMFATSPPSRFLSRDSEAAHSAGAVASISSRNAAPISRMSSATSSLTAMTPPGSPRRRSAASSARR